MVRASVGGLLGHAVSLASSSVKQMSFTGIRACTLVEETASGIASVYRSQSSTSILIKSKVLYESCGTGLSSRLRSGTLPRPGHREGKRYLSSCCHVLQASVATIKLPEPGYWEDTSLQNDRRNAVRSTSNLGSDRPQLEGANRIPRATYSWVFRDAAI